MWFEVYDIVEGADGGSSSSCTDEDAAEAVALDTATMLATDLPDATWSVFILPHYCSEDDECVCSSWLTDHHPRYSHEDAADLRSSIS